MSIHTPALLSCVYTSEQIQQMEKPLLENDVPLMQQASQSLAHFILSVIEHDYPNQQIQLVFLIGSGNNGADALYAATHIARQHPEMRNSIQVVLTSEKIHEEAFNAYSSIPNCTCMIVDNALKHTKTTILDNTEVINLKTLYKIAHRNNTILIDAITGIGVRGALQEPIAKIIASCQPEQNNPCIIACDIPSGLGINDASIPGEILPATYTLTFGALKPCCILPPANQYCGKIYVSDISLPLNQHKPYMRIADAALAASVLRQARANDTKYSRSVAGLITGSDTYPGAGILSAKACALSNIGMVRYFASASLQQMVLQTLPEVLCQPFDEHAHVQSWTVGSGVSAHDLLQQQSVAHVLRTCVNTCMPVCVDAGALDVIQPRSLSANMIITPHIGELARLLQRFGEHVSVEQIEQCPLFWAKKAHELTGANVLLKGATTIIVGNECDEILVNTHAPSQLATAGSGDVLAGIIGAMLAQQSDNTRITRAAAAAVFIHSMAAFYAANTHDVCNIFQYTDRIVDSDTKIGKPIIASDIVSHIPDVIQSIMNTML
ncbi:MAG: NAD(P)H-hydrate dehydratase [Bifidobacteriaceae bacterium]|nr:NAD(P)H-hydrate dehydratase [Bifidobacteriaceae bacterium]